MKNIFSVLAIAGSLFLAACGGKNPDDSSFNIFSVEDDIALGQQVAEEIEANPDQYPILDSAQCPEAYAHLYRIRDSILESDDLFYKERFPWRLRIVQNDSVLNAFAAPGGYLYFYTGLIHFLDQEHALAGVVAHEMAHADRRHVTDQLTKIYGIQLLLSVLLGNNQSVLSDIAATLAVLSFSRDAEAEADAYSVRYLCDTEYKADGAAVFFQKLQDEGQTGGAPEFLSTHPDPGNRVQDIQSLEQQLNCPGEGTYDARYTDFKSDLDQCY